jgi:sialic acid synthase SpsE
VTKPYIIAEIGSNWKMGPETSTDQDLACAIKCVRKAQECGADAVKFQLFDHEALYGVKGDSPFALNPEFLDHLHTICEEVGIDVMCTAFDSDGVDYVDPYVKIHKIASSSLSNADLLDSVMMIDKPFLYSNGMNTAEFADNENAIPMLCASLYPAEIWDYDLSSIGKIMSKPWGLSDHTKGVSLAKVCAGHGATFFEKHFNPVYNEYSPDVWVSIGIDKFKKYVDEIHCTPLGRPFRVRANARVLYADRYDEKLGRFCRPLIKENN